MQDRPVHRDTGRLVVAGGQGLGTGSSCLRSAGISLWVTGVFWDWMEVVSQNSLMYWMLPSCGFRND